jgi:quercetin dioxygenase-like cupin family protein
MALGQDCCHLGDGVKDLNRLPQLAQPILHFNLLREIRSLRKQESWSRRSGRSSKTLVKHRDFRLVLVEMKAGTVMKEHRAEGRISIHTLAGRLRVKLANRVVELPAGELLALDCGMPHDVEGVTESAFLLTISWPKGARHE